MRVAVMASPTFRALARLPQGGGVEFVVARDLDEFRRSVRNADAALIAPRYGSALRDVWADLATVRWIHALGAGVETFPFDLLRQSDIVLTNSRGVYADALAEFVIAAIFWFARDLRRLFENQAAHLWQPYEVGRVEGATVGIIGYGGIGRAVGRRAEALGMRVMARGHRDGPPPEELIPASDYLVISTPLTPETERLIDAGRIAWMRPSAVLINVSRGPIVDENALIDALRGRRIRGAALDVFENEPLPPDHPLWSLDNVLISPHNADRTADSHDRAMDLFLRNLSHFRRGEPLENVVDFSRQY